MTEVNGDLSSVGAQARPTTSAAEAEAEAEGVAEVEGEAKAEAKTVAEVQAEDLTPLSEITLTA